VKLVPFPLISIVVDRCLAAGEENKQHKPWPNAQGDGKANACHGKGGNNRHPCQYWNQGNQSGKSKGMNKIEFDTFGNTGPHDATNFDKSLKNIANHL
jgi:hypothetical protein